MRQCSYKIGVHIELLEPGNYHTILRGRIGGAPVRIVLDTGASHTCLDAHFFHQVTPDIPVQSFEGINAGIGGNDFSVQLVDMPDFRLGHFRLPLYKGLALLDLSYINQGYQLLRKKPIQMILGNDFLIEHHAVISYKDNTLTFTK